MSLSGSSFLQYSDQALSSLQCHPQAKWLNVIHVCYPLHFLVFLYILLNASPETQRQWDFKEYETQRQMQRGTTGIFSSADCIAATTLNLLCSQSLGCALPWCESLHTPMQQEYLSYVERYLLRAQSYLQRQEVPASCEQVLHVCECWTGFLLSRSHLQGWRCNSAQRWCQEQLYLEARLAYARHKRLSLCNTLI